MGHGFEADKQNVPMSWDNKMRWTAHTRDPKKLSRIANAGFEGQEIISGAVSGTKMEKNVRLVSALNKLGYALLPGGIQGGTGDVKMIEQNTGKKARQVAQAALTASAISDFYQALAKKKTNHRFSYGQSRNGTPMLMYGRNF